MKNCDSCCWKLVTLGKWCACEKDEPEEHTCSRHEYTCEECDIDKAEYSYKGKKYCLDCMLNILEITSYTKTHYELGGDCVASEDDIEYALLDFVEGIDLLRRV